MKIFLTLFLFLLSLSINILSQIESEGPELIFSLDYRQITFRGGAEGMNGAMAMEYHQGHLYIASLKEILKVDMQGNVVDRIENSPKEKIFKVNIRDITFIGNVMYVYLPGRKEILLLEDKQIKEKYFINFYISNLEEIRTIKEIPFYFEPEFIMNVSGKIYFYDGYHSFALDDLTEFNNVHVYGLEDYDKVYINAKMDKPFIGKPITDCSIFDMSTDGMDYKNLNIGLTDMCNKTHEIFSIPLLRDTKCIFTPFDPFINRFLGDYFVFGAFGAQYDETHPNFSVIRLNQDFSITGVIKNLTYYSGFSGLDPRYQGSFTYDEGGNIYYCTNKFDWKNKNASIVEVYKILP
jgi:hypothetical protein